MDRLFLVILFNIFLVKMVNASGIDIVSEGTSQYVILTDDAPSKNELQAAEILQTYIYKVSDTQLKIINEQFNNNGPYIKIKNYNVLDKLQPEKEGFSIEEKDGNLYFNGYGKKGILYAVYSFIEQILHCKKPAPNEPAIIYKSNIIHIADKLFIEEYADLLYREVYSLAETDTEYLNWHKLNSMDESWGLWGHSVFKLVPPAIYWEKHPDYFALHNGKRQPIQLCLSNPEVFDIVLKALQRLIIDNPDKEFFSISANDNVGVCECEKCSNINVEERSDAGTLIMFVNGLSSKFLEKKFVTLAYQNTSWAPLNIKPNKNVYIMLSSIDVNRSEPIETSNSAKSFRNKLVGWKKLTDNIMIWDYYTQFTNLLAPFPVEFTFAKNISYLKKNNFYGIFAQMNEFTYGDMLELKMYLLAKLMWNSELDEELIIKEFLDVYYKNAAPYVKEYLDKRKQSIIETKVNLDIYGNPINNQLDYLSPKWMDAYSTSLDKAQQMAEDPVLSEKILRLRLPLEYAYIQQARSYGIHPYGIWSNDTVGNIKVNENIKIKLENIYSLCKITGIKYVTEDGITLEAFKSEWDSILKTVPENNLAVDADLILNYPFVEEYGVKGVKTLHDRLSGDNDYSFNYLCFDGIPLDCLIDFGVKKDIHHISLSFLENQKLWIYKPEKIMIYVSNDNKNFILLDDHTLEIPDKFLGIRKYNYTYDFKNASWYRYIRVVAIPLSFSPTWSLPTFSRKPMIACDEVWVQ